VLARHIQQQNRGERQYESTDSLKFAFAGIVYTPAMGDFLLELLLLFADFLLEVVLEFAGEVVIDLIQRTIAEGFRTSRAPNPVRASLAYAFFGTLAGGLSLFIFPHPLVHPSRIHGISLLLSPLVTGLLMSVIGSTLRRQGKKVVQIESFWYGFVFALGMAVVRYLYI